MRLEPTHLVIIKALQGFTVHESISILEDVKRGILEHTKTMEVTPELEKLIR